MFGKVEKYRTVNYVTINDKEYKIHGNLDADISNKLYSFINMIGYTENNENARHFLRGNDLSEATIEAVITAVNSVSFSQNQGRTPETLEGKIVQDADRLDAMGAVGIARTFAYGGEHGRPMEASVQHFYDKLLRLKDLMNTESARRIAAERYAFLVAYLEELRKETEAE